MNRLSLFFGTIASLFKKDVKLYGSKIFSFLLLLLILVFSSATALFAILSNDSEKSEERLLSLALFDKEPSAITSNAIRLISNTKSIKNLFSLEMCDSEELVREGIRNGKYDGALIFSEGYFRRVLAGDDSAVEILLSDSVASVAGMIENFADTGEILIRHAEAGIEGLYPVLSELCGKSEASKMLRTVEGKLALRLFEVPTDAFEARKVDYSPTGTESASFFSLCYIAFLMFILEAVFFTYTTKDCAPSMLRRIKSYRISSLSIVIEKSLIPFFVRALIFFLGAMALSSFTEVSLTPASVLYSVVALLFISLFSTALSVLLSKSSLGISVIFAICVFSLIIAGGILPKSTFPYAVSQISSFTPLFASMKLFAPTFGGYFAPLSILDFGVVTAIFIALACRHLNRICERGDER